MSPLPPALNPRTSQGAIPAAAPPPGTAALVRVRVRSWVTLKRLTGRFRPHRGRTVFVLSIQLVRSVLELAVPFLIGTAVGSLQGLEGSNGTLPAAFLTRVHWLIGALVLRAISQYAVAVTSAALAQDLENELRIELFSKVLALPFRWHDENRSGKTIARSLGDMEKAKAFYKEVAFGYVEILLLVIGVIVLSFTLHWSYGLAASLICLGAFVATAMAGSRIARLDRAVSDHYDKVTTALQENVAGARVVRAFGQEPAEIRRFDGHLGIYSGAWRGLERFWTTVLPIVNHAMVLVIPVSLLVGGLRVAGDPGPVRLGEALAVLLYMRTLRDRTRNLTRLVLVGQKAVASASRVFEVIDKPIEGAPPAHPKPLPAGGGDLLLEDVAFAYPGGRPILSAITLHVPAGGSLGLLGRTGSGKTSLVHLLPRFYDPDRGAIRIDGVDVRDLAPAELAAAVGLVFQEPFLFSATVERNVAYGRPDATREDVARACRLAAAAEFVEALPKGYDTLVGERGVSLSGGQRQRLTIARALVMEPRVLVFDDATAAVDALTESDLFRGIRAAAAGRTTLVISQRVTSVRWCDRIAVVEDGRITAIGRHEELLASSALYREIHEFQSLERAS